MLIRSIICFIALFVLGIQIASANYPGGIISLSFDKQSPDLPIVKYGLAEPVLIEQKDRWQIIVGISLTTLPGDYLVFVDPQNDDSPFTLHFNILPRSFAELPSSSLPVSITHKRFSNLDYQNTQQPTLPLDYPVSGKWHNVFGHIDTSNPEKTLQRNYISLSTTQLITVQAPQNAIVSQLTQNDDGTSTVFLDHGRGLYSILTGLSDLSIEEGNGINRGAVIGRLAANESNRLPSKLIWQCVLNGVYIDPELLLDKTLLKGD